MVRVKDVVFCSRKILTVAAVFVAISAGPFFQRVLLRVGWRFHVNLWPSSVTLDASPHRALRRYVGARSINDARDLHF